MSQYKRYCFLGEYFDPMASLVRQYQIFFYPDDQSVEIYDIKNRKIFLKRIINPDVTEKDVYLGAEVNIYSRKIRIIGYGDEFTRKQFEELRSSTFALILPSAYMGIGKIIDFINANGFQISKVKMNKLSLEEAKHFKTLNPSEVSSDLVVGLELVKENAVAQFKELAKKIETQFKELGQGKQIIYAADNNNQAIDDMKFFFLLKHQPQLTNCSCLLIKPHIINDGNAGKIVDIVLNEGFEISSMEMFYLDKANAEEFLDVYQGVLPEYAAILTHITSGPVLALEVRQDDVVNKLRALVGPHDPVLAQTLRPNTIRAIFGVDRVRNVCHCTDLPEDGVLECQFFFELL